MALATFAESVNDLTTGVDEPSNRDCSKHNRRFAPGRQDMSDRIATQLACGCMSLAHVQLHSGHYAFLTCSRSGMCARRVRDCVPLSARMCTVSGEVGASVNPEM
jgi:hypothetical protein